MFIFILFFITFFSSTFFATGITHSTVKPVLVSLQKDASFLKRLEDQYQEIKENYELLAEVSKKCDHVGHTLEYYLKEVSSIIDSEEKQTKKASELQNLLYDGKFILDQLNDYLN